MGVAKERKVERRTFRWVLWRLTRCPERSRLISGDRSRAGRRDVSLDGDDDRERRGSDDRDDAPRPLDATSVVNCGGGVRRPSAEFDLYRFCEVSSKR